jgi:CRP/FNR family cyclic AMP-dependent transcriptional regulator
MISPEALRRYPIFAGQSLYMLKEIALISDEIALEVDEWLFNERAEATEFYIIMEGAISLCLNLHLNGTVQHVETMSPLGKGEVIGWSSLVRPYQYTLGAKATKRTRLLAIEAAPLRELLEDNPAYGYYLLKNLTEVMGERLTFKCIQLLSIVLDLEGEPLKSPA